MGLLSILVILVFSGSVWAQDTATTRGLKAKTEVRLDFNSEDFKWYNNKYAIIIGIDDYKDPNTRDLDYAVEDAKAIQKLLVKEYNYKKENIELLLNEEATKSRIRSALFSFQKINKNSKLLFYFAGHGVTEAKPSGGKGGVLLTYESKWEKPKLTGIMMSQLKMYSSYVASKHQLFLVDACYGGLATASTRGLSNKSKMYLSSLLAENARTIITAGREDEQVIEKAEWGHSAFTKALLTGLEKESADLNNNQIITTNELFNFMQPRVQALSKGQQTPAKGSFTVSGGQFVFTQEDIGKIRTGSAPNAKNENLSSISVTSNPEDAKVYVNGKLQGTSPINLRLPRDTARIRISKEGYQDYQRSINLSESTGPVQADLSKAFAQVSVKSNVQGARFFLNGEMKGTTPWKGEVQTGVSKVKLKKPKYKTKVTRFHVSQPTDSVMVEMKRNKTQLTITSNVENADILVDGKKTGTTPYTGTFSLGTTNLKLKKENYESFEKYVTIRHQKDTLHYILDPIKLISVKSKPDSAKVYINGKLEGTTPLELKNLEPRKYTVRVEKDNYPPIRREFDLQKKPYYDKEFDLAERVGSINFSGYRGRADVTLESQRYVVKIDSLPRTQRYLPIGYYKLTIDKPGFKKYSKKVQLTDSNANINVSRVLEPKSKAGALVRSLFVSGWGHTYLDRDRQAQLYFLAGNAAGIYTLSKLLKLERDIPMEVRRRTKNQMATGAFAFFGMKVLELVDLLVTDSPSSVLKNGRIQVRSNYSSVGVQVNF